MIERLLHTPEGVRDIYGDECETKLILQNNIHKVMKLHGFKDIQTPSFEFFDIFSKERGTTLSKNMYKFFDREGQTLVLRPDFTPSIARCVSKYYKEETLPIRLCYVGNTFINNSSYQGKLKECTQIGAELINDGSVDADAQIIAITIECLLDSGLKEFQVEIGEADFFRSLVYEADFTKEEENQLRILIESKNFFGVEDLVLKKNISNSLKEVFLALPNLFGTQDKLTLAKSLTTNERAIEAINRLQGIYDILKMYGHEKYVTFDLGMLNKYNYYTGIIFNVYTYGTGEVIAGGGRYDNLVEQFGKKASAIGLAILVDPLMIALSRQKVTKEIESVNTLLLYEEALIYDAITLANHFRQSGMNMELLKYDGKLSIADYISYGNRFSIGGILYYKTNDMIEVINCQTGEINVASIKDFL
jgi:ATP phosphoribosyltransferase regulatory subunit